MRATRRDGNDGARHPSEPVRPRGAVERGTPEYGRIGVAFFLVGFAAFSLIYCVQPLLEEFTREFHVSASRSALALSLTTGLLAVAILAASAAGERFSRRSLLFTSMCGAALLNVVAALAPSWSVLLIVRAAEGLVLGGVPAVAMAHLAEEIDSRDLGRAMGVYVGGTAFGGMLGRVGTGFLTEFSSWRVALAVLGVLGLLAALAFRFLLPAPRQARPTAGMDVARHLRAWREHVENPTLRRLFVLGFINLGVFVAVFNYLGFRLSAAPYHVGHAQLSLLFTVYLFGVAASPVSGAAADRFGRGTVLLWGIVTSMGGLVLTLAASLAAVILGVILMTVGFFVTHSVASGWVGRVASAHKGHASSLYLLSYYLGSSVVGLAGGWFWTTGAWTRVVLFTGVLLAAALSVGLHLARTSDGPARS